MRGRPCSGRGFRTAAFATSEPASQLRARAVNFLRGEFRCVAACEKAPGASFSSAQRARLLLQRLALQKGPGLDKSRATPAVTVSPACVLTTPGYRLIVAAGPFQGGGSQLVECVGLSIHFVFEEVHERRASKNRESFAQRIQCSVVDAKWHLEVNRGVHSLERGLRNAFWDKPRPALGQACGNASEVPNLTCLDHSPSSQCLFLSVHGRAVPALQ